MTVALIARERILATANELFTRRGVNDVGVDEIVESAAVAKTALYPAFPFEGGPRIGLPRGTRATVDN